ncbi:dihydrofolate reductase [Melissococcus plutonius]|uniref:Dihydrofolate reductase n=2 Tax=Melissococcus plutonius TaxID=33970 RepID=F3YAK7_MELPT|nr:dihydrofolate reductase [Melissococcus plutonius]BAL62107.1 dihydrofolate reductase [Melissococcus plutonius DAT561]AIM24996.1 dihydrofolate reductase FolA [Melissococcus plutonius S1]KMT25160.1 dihydrofolate reductase FolA [Melissococcus plutonius]KMT26797.1 dihydrofolate reductase FolA [Melissococcus plutonius]KMT28047.1 dihydrofolate reductase FolA [Melissococcus plutonius]
MLSAIWAQDEQGTIGLNDKLPWHLPNDLKFFKQTTENNTLIMGRKTFEGMGKRSLPNRITIVLTHDQHYQVPDGVLVMHTINEVLDYAKNFSGITFITGGATVYKAFLPYCEVLYRTVIHHTFKGDTQFPKVHWEEWTKINTSKGETDEKNNYSYEFETYQRKVYKNE